MFKNWYIKFNRYILGKQFLPIMKGHLKGYLWTTKRNYEYILGTYEDPQTLERLISWCKKDTVLYDIGANVGYHAFIANLFITDGRVYSFEPMPVNISLFNEHLTLNKKRMLDHNISLLTFAISDKEKEVQFSNNEVATDGNTYITSSQVYKQAGKMLRVQCFSIDNLLEKAYEPPTILKIDVEGAELDVLKGAVNTLATYKPNILLATHNCHLPGIKEECVSFLKNLGYVLEHTGNHNKQMQGLDDFIAIHHDNLSSL
jgi:FkbM family methyltransferase